MLYDVEDADTIRRVEASHDRDIIADVWAGLLGTGSMAIRGTEVKVTRVEDGKLILRATRQDVDYSQHRN